MKSALFVAAALMLGLSGAACSSTHQSGVTSDYRTQWTDVHANTRATTDAAKAVLNDNGLKNVTANSTEVDGHATAQKADGTKVNVTVQKQSDTKSQVSVVVGTVGEPKLGADLAKQIKQRAEGGAAMTQP